MDGESRSDLGTTPAYEDRFWGVDMASGGPSPSEKKIH